MRLRAPKAARARSTELGSDDLADWRERRLRRAGSPAGLARELAGDCRVDLHALLTLVERGCPPGPAARIVAPLEEERRPC